MDKSPQKTQTELFLLRLYRELDSSDREILHRAVKAHLPKETEK